MGNGAEVGTVDTAGGWYGADAANWPILKIVALTLCFSNSYSKPSIDYNKFLTFCLKQRLFKAYLNAFNSTFQTNRLENLQILTC